MNIVYYSEIRSSADGISSGESLMMLIFSIVIFAAAAITLIWSTFRLITHREYRKEKGKTYGDKIEEFMKSDSIGYRGSPSSEVRTPKTGTKTSRVSSEGKVGDRSRFDT